MSAPNFVHLRLHSEYSITDGLTRIDDAVSAAIKDGQAALAITDLANLFGMIKFYSAARAKGIKPIIGCDVWIADDETAQNKPDANLNAVRILLLCRNRPGYLRLCQLLTSAYLAPRHQGRPEISRAALANGDNTGLIALSGAGFGDVGQLLQAEKISQAEQRARAWAALFPDAFYIEVQRAARMDVDVPVAAEESLLAASVNLAARLGLPVVATHPIQFLAPSDAKAHDARVCIAEGHVLSDKRRRRAFSDAQYFKSQAEMLALFADLPEAIENAVEISKRCNLTLELGKNRLPDFPTPDGVTLEDFLASESHIGLEKRLAVLYPDIAARDVVRQKYVERLDFEVATIVNMKFPGYFLIVADFINWAKNNGVPVGPGRGSGAGSLVAYSLGITDLDPIKYELLFERFLNPERVSMPDFDIDFCQEGRDRVIDYVKKKYGAHAVSQIVTFGTMAAKAVIRDVGRVLNLGFNQVDQFAKLIPKELEITLAKARLAEPAIEERIKNEEDIAELWSLAEKLEGLARNVGMHAGGVLIAPGKLTDFCPLYAADGASAAVSQFDKGDVELAGLVKFDFLGLRTLTILDETVKLIREVEGIEINLETLPLDDKSVYDTIFKNANTTAVFQFESTGMKDTLIQARPDRLDDLIALNALYRPGPMDFIPNFVNRKHGREPVNYPHPLLEKVLSNTYGIMVYQEQVMQTAQVIANFTLGGADEVRRAMGKKDVVKMDKQRVLFIEGAAQNNIGAEKANEIFDIMYKFAGYGFNKSHAAAYSLVAYHTGWLKRHHTAAFTAATLSSEMANTDKVHFFYKDGVDNGLTFLPPDINISGIRFLPTDAKTVRYGLGAIKGTGEAALSIIIANREADGKFTDLFEFMRRVDRRLVNRRVIEALIRAGAFDSIDSHRAKLLASVAIATEAADQAERNALQGGLFDAPSGEIETPAYRDVPQWTERERLMNEKSALGFFLSGHPYNEVASELKSFVKYRLGQLSPSRETVLMAGIVLAFRSQMSRGGKMAVVTLDDADTQLEVVIYNELWDAQRAKVVEDDVLIIEGKISKDNYSGNTRVVAEKLLTMSEARNRYARKLVLTMNGGSDAKRLQSLLKPFGSGPCPVVIRYSNSEASADIDLSEQWNVRLEDGLITDLNAWLTKENFRIDYR
ncbi:MAG: DNA polymerase III subunit alpha [Rhodocyclaceae bacterium]|nr:DNA polymerase III subunit alpha [Rhodocyclaceae bacterium]